MASRRIIGADLGGTKRLAGAVDLGLSVHHRVQRTDVGLDQSAVLATAIDVVADVPGEAGDGIDAIGSRVPVSSAPEPLSSAWEPVL